MALDGNILPSFLPRLDIVNYPDEPLLRDACNEQCRVIEARFSGSVGRR